MMTPSEWLAVAKARIVIDIGQLDRATRKALDNAARRGELAKWRGHWAPVPGAPWGLGPLKTCFGPVR